MSYYQARKANSLFITVHVDVDFMGPFVTSVKKASRDVWMHLPPPVRQAAPYVGAGMGTGILVFNIQQRRLDHAVRMTLCYTQLQQHVSESIPCWLQNAKSKALEQRLEIVITERDDAKVLAKELKVLHWPWNCSYLPCHLCFCSIAASMRFDTLLRGCCSPRPHDRKVPQRCRW